MAEPATGWDPGLYDGKHAFVWQYGASLLELLAPKPGERILDLGCGTGHLTAQIADRGADVLGIDSDEAMIEQARRGYPKIRFERQDARDFHFSEPFDAVFSNAVLHWIREPERAIACVRRALKAGGRFVAEFGGKGNVRQIVEALVKVAETLGCGTPALPWYYPGIAEYTSLLERHGLEVTFATLFDRPTPLEGEQGLRNWVTMFARDVLRQLPSERHEDYLRALETALRPSLYDDGQWHADYRRLRIVAHVPPATSSQSPQPGS
jgi:trans-aconitate 2-methyltransferase